MASDKGKKKPDFTGTYSVLIKLDTLTNDIVNVMFDHMIGNNVLLRDENVHSGNPMENDPHITVLMGLEEDDVGIASTAAVHSAKFDVKIGKFGFFQSEDKLDNGEIIKNDVLYREVISEELTMLHKKISSGTGKKWHFPEYKPHATYFYMKYGAAKEYADKLNKEVKEKVIPIDYVVIKKFKVPSTPIFVELGTVQE